MPGVLLRALSEYKFVGIPLWRMSDGKHLVRVELTFHKALPTKPYYKRRAESRRQPAPSAGEWPRQPVPASRPPPGQEPTQIERETLPPTTQTIQQTSQQIIRPRYKNTASITASPIITRPAPAPASPESPPSKKPRKKSPEPAKIAQSSAATTPMKNLSRSTRSMTSRILSATSSMEKTLPSSRLKDSCEKKTRWISTCQPTFYIDLGNTTGYSSRDQRRSTTMRSFTTRWKS